MVRNQDAGKRRLNSAGTEGTIVDGGFAIRAPILVLFGDNQVIRALSFCQLIQRIWRPK
jgi:hypothetical protein